MLEMPQLRVIQGDATRLSLFAQSLTKSRTGQLIGIRHVLLSPIGPQANR